MSLGKRPVVGETVRFLPEHCMMQMVQSAPSSSASILGRSNDSASLVDATTFTISIVMHVCL